MTLYEICQYVAAFLVLLGGAFTFLSALGIVRLPDLYTRMHAASKAGVVGSGLALVGLAIVSLDGAVILRSILGILFLVLTTPVSAHLLARAAWRAGVEPSASTSINDLATHDSK